MSIQAGRYRHPIDIEEGTETQNAHGEPIITWSHYETRRARIRTMKGREFWAAQQVNAEQTVEFRTRYDSRMAAVTTKMRVVWDGKNWDIQDAQDVDEMHKEFLIIATHRVGT